MVNEQSWKTCKSSVGYKLNTLRFEPTESGGQPTPIDHEPVYISYYCENEAIVKLGVYPTMFDVPDQGSTKKAELFRLGSVGHIQLDSQTLKLLEARIEKGLTMCKHCRFYEAKEKT